MKRLLVGFLIFLGLLFVLLVPTIVKAGRTMSREQIVGFGFVLGSPAENIVRVLILVLFGVLAYWVSGKLVTQ